MPGVQGVRQVPWSCHGPDEPARRRTGSGTIPRWYDPARDAGAGQGRPHVTARRPALRSPSTPTAPSTAPASCWRSSASGGWATICHRPVRQTTPTFAGRRRRRIGTHSSPTRTSRPGPRTAATACAPVSGARSCRTSCVVRPRRSRPRSVGPRRASGVPRTASTTRPSGAGRRSSASCRWTGRARPATASTRSTGWTIPGAATTSVPRRWRAVSWGSRRSTGCRWPGRSSSCTWAAHGLTRRCSRWSRSSWTRPTDVACGRYRSASSYEWGL